jgi:hypothetical protein
MAWWDTVRRLLGGAGQGEGGSPVSASQADDSVGGPTIPGWDGPETEDPEVARRVAEIMGCVTHEAFTTEAYQTPAFQRSLDGLSAAGASGDLVSILRRASLRLPGHVPLAARLARLYTARYDNHSARRLWEELARDAALAAEANFHLGEIAERQDRLPEAAAYYQRALVYEFTYPNALARAERLRGHLPSARKGAAPTVGGVAGSASVGLAAPAGYELSHPLGRGGYGTVYLAYEVALRREVAIKFLHPHLTRGERNVPAFVAEARLVARLQVPGVVRIFDLEVADRVIVMEYMTRGTLRDRLSSGRPLSPVAALDVAEHLLDTLGQLHDRGVLHRDIKPSNILFRSDGSPVLGDFGVATLESEQTGGRAAGTVMYMAPEQRTGRGQVDRRADLYAIGLVLAEMIAGGLPAATASVVQAPDAFLSAMPQGVADGVLPVLTALLAVEPGLRPEDAQEACERVRSARRRFTAQRLAPELVNELALFAQTTGVDLPGIVVE